MDEITLVELLDLGGTLMLIVVLLLQNRALQLNFVEELDQCRKLVDRLVDKAIESNAHDKPADK